MKLTLTASMLCLATGLVGAEVPSGGAPTPGATAGAVSPAPAPAEASAVAVLDAGKATIAGRALAVGDVVRLNQAVEAAADLPCRLLVPGLGRGELVLRPGTACTVAVQEQADGRRELLVTVLRGAVSVEGADAKAPLPAVRLRGQVAEAVVQGGGALLSVDEGEGGDRVVALGGGTVAVALLAGKSDPWQRAGERLDLAPRQVVQARRTSGLELATAVAARPTLARGETEWKPTTGETPAPAPAGGGTGWSDEEVLKLLGAASWDRLAGSPEVVRPSTFKVIVGYAHDDNIPRSSAGTPGGPLLTIQGLLQGSLDLGGGHSLRGGIQGRWWEYPGNENYRLGMLGANAGWQYAKDKWFSGITAYGMQFWNQDQRQLYLYPNYAADVFGGRFDLGYLQGQHLLNARAGVFREFYPGAGTPRDRTGTNASLRLGDSVLFGDGCMIDVGLRGGYYWANAEYYTYLHMRPGIGASWRVPVPDGLGSIDLSLDYGWEWRRYKTNRTFAFGDESEPVVGIHELNLAADWWLLRNVAVGPYAAMTNQNSGSQATEPSYSRIEAGARATIAF